MEIIEINSRDVYEMIYIKLSLNMNRIGNVIDAFFSNDFGLFTKEVEKYEKSTKEICKFQLKLIEEMDSIIIERGKKNLRNVIFQDIDKEFAYGQYGEFDVIIMKRNGFVNATKLCKDGDKQFKNWLPNKNSLELINKTANTIGIDPSEMIINIVNGKNNIRGTYVHPTLITHIAYWCSSDFAVKVGLWIEAWKKYSKENNDEYWNTIKTMKFDFNNCKEKDIQSKLKHKLNGQIEIPTPFGDIDLLTDTKIIEIKTYENWKHALGQILVYSECYPDKKNVYIYLMYPIKLI